MYKLYLGWDLKSSKGPKDLNHRALGPKYHEYYCIWAPFFGSLGIPRLRPKSIDVSYLGLFWSPRVRAPQEGHSYTNPTFMLASDRPSFKAGSKSYGFASVVLDASRP